MEAPVELRKSLFGLFQVSQGKKPYFQGSLPAEHAAIELDKDDYKKRPGDSRALFKKRLGRSSGVYMPNVPEFRLFASMPFKSFASQRARPG